MEKCDFMFLRLLAFCSNWGTNGCGVLPKIASVCMRLFALQLIIKHANWKVLRITWEYLKRKLWMVKGSKRIYGNLIWIDDEFETDWYEFLGESNRQNISKVNINNISSSPDNKFFKLIHKQQPFCFNKMLAKKSKIFQIATSV